MRRLICLAIPLLFLTACESLPNEGKAAAILDAAVPASRKHAAALVGDDLDAMRATGLELITIVNCHPDGC
jgi:hypothetical protein